jgi:predicted 3-demethylubiquinone-9 3-methyltransferase (glyoxalase superfamily)
MRDECAEPERTVLTVSFTLDGQEDLALNGGPGLPVHPGDLVPDHVHEVDHYWDGLTADGGQSGPAAA